MLFRSRVPINIAKRGIVLEGQGVGDILIHTRDNLGYPVAIRLSNCIYCPDGIRLMSLFTLSTMGFQPVMPAKDPHFQPGLYLPRDSTGVQRYVPFVVQNGLCFIPSTDQGPEGRTVGPLTRQAKVEQVSRRLGYMPMETLRDCVQSGCIDGHGLSVNTSFPRTVLDAARKIGRAHV